MNTIVPPTTMFSASIVLVNQSGSGGGTGSIELAHDPRAQEDRDPRDEPPGCIPDIREDERGEWREDPPEADGAGGTNPPSGIMDSVGAKRIATCPTRNSCLKSWVREKMRIVPASTTK